MKQTMLRNGGVLVHIFTGELEKLYRYILLYTYQVRDVLT